MFRWYRCVGFPYIYHGICHRNHQGIILFHNYHHRSRFYRNIFYVSFLNDQSIRICHFQCYMLNCKLIFRNMAVAIQIYKHIYPCRHYMYRECNIAQMLCYLQYHMLFLVLMLVLVLVLEQPLLLQWYQNEKIPMGGLKLHHHHQFSSRLTPYLQHLLP